jgi:hypothetical protein
MMQIRVGFEMIFDCPQPTPMIFNLNVHFTRVSDLVGRDALRVDPPIPMSGYRDDFGNWCTRIVAPKGQTRVTANAIVNDTGLPDVLVPEAQQIPVPELPEDTLIFLLGSPYCDTDRFRRRRGTSLGRHRLGGTAFRQSATTSIATSPSTTSTRTTRARRWKRSTNVRASAATSRILPLPSVAA